MARRTVDGSRSRDARAAVLADRIKALIGPRSKEPLGQSGVVRGMDVRERWVNITCERLETDADEIDLLADLITGWLPMGWYISGQTGDDTIVVKMPLLS